MCFLSAAAVLIKLIHVLPGTKNITYSAVSVLYSVSPLHCCPGWGSLLIIRYTVLHLENPVSAYMVVRCHPAEVFLCNTSNLCNSPLLGPGSHSSPVSEEYVKWTQSLYVLVALVCVKITCWQHRNNANAMSMRIFCPNGHKVSIKNKNFCVILSLKIYWTYSTQASNEFISKKTKKKNQTKRVCLLYWSVNR